MLYVDVHRLKYIQIQLKWNIRKFNRNAMDRVNNFYNKQRILIDQLSDNLEQLSGDIDLPKEIAKECVRRYWWMTLSDKELMLDAISHNITSEERLT